MDNDETVVTKAQPEEPKADVVLSDGREITFDLNLVTKREYDRLFDRTQADREESETFSKVSGLTPDEIESLPLLDWKRFALAFFKRAADPIANDPKN